MLPLKDLFVKHESRIVLFLGLVLISFISYGVGRISAPRPKEAITIQASSQEVSKSDFVAEDEIKQDIEPLSIKTQNETVDSRKTGEKEGAIKNTGLYVASKNGAKYHLPSCPGAKRIKEENKIWFDSKAEAEKAGYEPAKNCKGI